MASEPQGSLLYVDTSALVKLVVHEAESEALEAELNRWSDRATSALTTVELPRAVARRELEDVVRPELVDVLLAVIDEVSVNREVLRTAAQLGPPELGTLDAIHLASALSLGEDLGGLLSYDRQLLQAAAGVGVATLRPGLIA